MRVNQVIVMNLDTALEKEIAEIDDNEDVLLIRPGGNNGDTLIYKGLEKVLDENNTTYDTIEPTSRGHINSMKYVINRVSAFSGYMPVNELPTDRYDIVIIHGGGNFKDIGGLGVSIHYLQYLNKNMSNSKIILAPQSCWLGSKNLSSIISDNNSNEICLFTRERYSYNLLKRQNENENTTIKLSPDTALYLDKEYLKKYITSGVTSGNTLLAFRDDRESIISESCIKKLENSRQNTSCLDISNKDKYSLSEFVSITNSADKVFTDRLHVSIIGYLLNKEVILFPNRYYKNRGVYDYVFKDSENIHLCEIGRKDLGDE